MASGYTWSAKPSSTINYKAYERLDTNKSPSLDCSRSSDILNIPVGLITADEVAYAGGVYGSSNSSYYLYTDQNYWTLSPYYFNGYNAFVFRVNSSGYLTSYFVDGTSGVRPAINLRADTTFTGTGTSDDPYTVV